MKNILRAVYEPALGSFMICCFLLCIRSKDVAPITQLELISRALPAPPQDTATKGEILLKTVIPAMRKDAERKEDAAYSKVHAKMLRQEREIADLKGQLRQTEQYVVALLTKELPDMNDYEAAEPCPTDTVKLYYKKTIFGKLKPIKEP